MGNNVEHISTKKLHKQVCIVAGVVIKKDDNYLLVQENRPGTMVHGLWNFPAGRVDEGESIEQTAIREAKEEVGYDVELIRKIDIYQSHSDTPPKHAFEAKIIGGKLDWPKDEILDARWFSWQEIQEMKERLREDWVIEAIRVLEGD
jgi:8-oxo-dGTP diphosphatase